MNSRLRLLLTLLMMGAGVALLQFSGPSGCAANCGNGELNEGEACDDGNKDDGDGCSSTCELESDGTTGGTTTGGTTGGATGGTTTGGTGGAGGDTCTTAADCADSYSSAPVCRSPETCQGDRQDAACNKGVCTSLTVEDDSACTAASFTLDCDPDLSCDGTASQLPLTCEVCDDTDDNDGDALIDCQDTVDCPNGTPCAGGLCSAGNCVD